MQLESPSYSPCCRPDGVPRGDQLLPAHPRCTHCPELETFVDKCEEAACPILEITSQCTDQCVVVACDDPTHPEPSCHVAGGDTVCDSACLVDEDCADCPGLEELLRCCTDYHSYLSQPKSFDLDIPQSNWDASSAGDFCGCSESDYREQHVSLFLPEHQAICPITRPLGHILPECRASSTSSAFSSPALSQTATQFPSVSLQQHLPQCSTPIFSCEWGNCKAAFPSLAELVGHVNVDHLRFPNLTNESAPQPLCSDVPNQQFDLNALSCHWRDCVMYPCPESIPGSSMTAFPDTVLDVLTTHLMQDHLGVHYPFPQSTTVRTAAPAKTTPACAGKIAPSPPQSSPDTRNESDTPSDTSPRDNSHSHPQNSSPTYCGAKPCKWIGCTEFFSSPDDLTAHILSAHIGSGKAHYECYWEGCTRHGEQGFASKQKVARHMQSHTGHRPFQCKICGQYFSETATLQQHMRRHTQEKPYVCDVPGCGKAFAITGALTIHKRTHNGFKPFKCKYCEKAFTESSNLSKHLRTHTGARPYPCLEDGCGKSFARPDQLARHTGVHRKKSLGRGVE
ncbi:hypothetical protein K503DRAFT_688831 [Rhizopogon vinicolor AM-OR11-026]|uniref:C2H2-type domain-containing protein n=1 Tax=Rhizopogon vinicolor AM-OR11-026 TaxID=1314800 RepID=A0A1B7N4P3_9AGAM|nr:hypothetical protein K503DRAFT_688831 [Rhizopogon vinicolor AM-OR11-026]